MSGRAMQPTYYSQYNIETACSWTGTTEFKDFDQCRINQCIKLSNAKECISKSVSSPNKKDIDMSLPECTNILHLIHYEKVGSGYIAIDQKTRKPIEECKVKGVTQENDDDNNKPLPKRIFNDNWNRTEQISICNCENRDIETCPDGYEV